MGALVTALPAGACWFSVLIACSVVGFGGWAAELGATTVTMNVAEEVFPDGSRAVQVTVVEPMGKSVPRAGSQVTVTDPELSLDVGAGYETIAPLALVADTVTLPGAVT